MVGNTANFAAIHRGGRQLPWKASSHLVAGTVRSGVRSNLHCANHQHDEGDMEPTDLIVGMPQEKNKFSYAAYFDGTCKAICSADPDFVKFSSQWIRRWKKAGADVKLLPSKQYAPGGFRVDRGCYVGKRYPT